MPNSLLCVPFEENTQYISHMHHIIIIIIIITVLWFRIPMNLSI